MRILGGIRRALFWVFFVLSFQSAVDFQGFAATERCRKNAQRSTAVQVVPPRLSRTEAWLEVSNLFKTMKVIFIAETGQNYVFRVGSFAVKVPRTEEALELSKNEKRMLSAVGRAPREDLYKFMRIVDYHNDLPALVMPFASEGSLADSAFAYGPYKTRYAGPFRQPARFWAVFDVMQEMATVVKALHELGIVHNDIKAANFMYMNGRLALSDFELASMVGQPITCEPKGCVSGTPGYMSTHRFGSEIPVFSDDLFSLSRTYQRLLLGKGKEDDVFYVSPHTRNRKVDPMLSAIAWHQFKNADDLLLALSWAKHAFRIRDTNWFFKRFTEHFLNDEFLSRQKPETLRQYTGDRAYVKEVEGSDELKRYLLSSGVLSQEEHDAMIPDPSISLAGGPGGTLLDPQDGASPP